MDKTLADRVAGPVPAQGDRIWEQLPKWLAAAPGLPSELEPALTIAHLQANLDHHRRRKMRGLNMFVSAVVSKPLVHRLESDLRTLGLDDAAEIAMELPALFKADTLGDIPDRLWHYQDAERHWERVADLSTRMAECDTDKALWDYLQSNGASAQVPAPEKKSFLSRLFGN
jgi:hypothetical protein